MAVRKEKKLFFGNLHSNGREAEMITYDDCFRYDNVSGNGVEMLGQTKPLER